MVIQNPRISETLELSIRHPHQWMSFQPSIIGMTGAQRCGRICISFAKFPAFPRPFSSWDPLSFTKCSPWVQLSHLECGFITSFHSYHFWEVFKRDYIKMSGENPDMEKTWKNNLCMKSLKCPIWWSHPSTFNLTKNQTFNHPNLAKMVVQVEVPEPITMHNSPFIRRKMIGYSVSKNYWITSSLPTKLLLKSDVPNSNFAPPPS